MNNYPSDEKNANIGTPAEAAEGVNETEQIIPETNTEITEAPVGEQTQPEESAPVAEAEDASLKEPESEAPEAKEPTPDSDEPEAPEAEEPTSEEYAPEEPEAVAEEDDEPQKPAEEKKTESVDKKDGKATEKKVNNGGAKKLLYLLIPAAILTLYAFLVAVDALPARIYIGQTRIRLVGILDSGFLRFLSLVSYIVLPVIALAVYVFNYRSDLVESTAPVAPAPTVTYTPVFAPADEGEKESVVVTDEAEVPTEAPLAEAEITAPEASVLPESVDYVDLKIIDSDSGIRQDDVHNDDLTATDIIDGFSAFAATEGVKLPTACAQRIISAMSASKVLWVKGKSREITIAAVSALAKYFGQSLECYRMPEGISDPRALSITAAKGGKYVTSEFAKAVYSANYAKDSVRFAAIYKVTEASCEFLHEYITGLDVPDRQRSAAVVSEGNSMQVRYLRRGRLQLSDNLWYILIPASEDVAKSIPDTAVAVDISDASLCDKTPATERTPVVSYQRFYELGKQLKVNSYIPEEYWKKIDALEEYINKYSGFELDNVSIRRIEAMAGVLIATGADIYTTIDTVIAAKILPALAECKKEDITGEEDGIITFMDRIFGLDNMPLCHEYFRKLGVA